MECNSSFEESIPLLLSKSYKSSENQDGQSRQSSNPDNVFFIETRVYKKRWYMLVVFCTVAFTQGLMWNTWSPLGDALFVGFGWSDDFLAFSLAVSSAGIVVFTIPIMYIIETYGLRKGALLGVSMMLAATITWNLASFFNQSWLFVLGCLFVGVASGVALAGPPLLSVLWFPVSERTTATAFASMSTHVGIGVAFVTGPAISGVSITADEVANPSNVSDDKISAIEGGVSNVIYVITAIVALCFFSVLAHFPAKPASPPSRAQTKVRVSYWAGLKQISRNKHFWILNMAFNIANGTFNAWMPLVSVNFSSSLGLDESEGDWIGFAATLISCFGSVGIALVVDRYKTYTKTVLQLMSLTSICLFAILGCIQAGFIVLSEESVKVTLYLLVIGIALCLNGGVPFFYELGCEITYPVYEGLSAAYITVVNDICGLLFYALFFIPALEAENTWMTWVCLGACICSFPMLVLLKENFNRLNVESEDNVLKGSTSSLITAEELSD